MRVEISARSAGSLPSPLVLLGKGSFDDSPSSADCEQIPGASVAGETTWEVATIEFEGVAYTGVPGEAAFTVPDVPPGLYYLAESIDATGTGCHVFMSFEVTDAALPDTAISHQSPGRMVVAELLAVLVMATGREGIADADRAQPSGADRTA